MNNLKVQSRIDSVHNEKDAIVTELLVDDRLLADFKGSSLSVDLSALERSVYQSGEFFIITCVCGDPGCAGVKQGIQVSHTDKSIHWVVRGLGETQTFYFHPQEYQTAVEHGIKQLEQMMKRHNLEVAPEINKRRFEKLGRAR